MTAPKAPGIAGYTQREAATDDPLVCACGVTLGTKRLEGTDTAAVTALARVLARHEPEHRARLAHAQRHASLSGRCPECGPVAVCVTEGCVHYGKSIPHRGDSCVHCGRPSRELTLPTPVPDHFHAPDPAP